MTTERNLAEVGNQRRVTLIDGSPDAQAWVDALVQAAENGVGDWPHQHPRVPSQQITIAHLWKAIETSFRMNNKPWSIVKFGFPALPTQSDPGSAAAFARATNAGAGASSRPPKDDPHKGSILHNAMHAAFGNFH